jgi:hypothetical protein
MIFDNFATNVLKTMVTVSILDSIPTVKHINITIKLHEQLIRCISLYLITKYKLK